MARLKMKEHFYNVLQDKDFDILLMIGGYSSGKSFTGFLKTALLGTMEKRNMLVIRKVYATLKDSCFADLKDAVEILGVSDRWKFIKSPYEAINKYNGSRIIFKGMDDYRKIKSIKNIDYIIIEEADELTIDDIKELRKRLRVLNIKKHIILMCNPISRLSSVYKMFFTNDGFNFNENELYNKKLLVKKDILTLEDGTQENFILKVHHSTYKDNPFLPPSFIYEIENEKDPRIRRIARDGKFGADGDLVLYNATYEKNVFEKYVKDKIDYRDEHRGIDWGHSISYTCGLKMAVNHELNELYIFWEFYGKGLTTLELMDKLKPLNDSKVIIYADSASSQTIADFYDAGFNILGAKKGAGSVAYHEQLLRSFSRIVIDIDRCPMTSKEIQECVYKKDTAGNITIGNYNIDAHSIDAMAYGLEEYDFIPLKDRLKDKKIIGI